MTTKEPTPSKIVQNPRLWPNSFSQPVTSQQTCIRTYIFKDGTKVEKFLDFVNKSFPNKKLDLKQLEDGKISVSFTDTRQIQVTNDAGTPSSCTLKNCKQTTITSTETFSLQGPASSSCYKVYFKKCKTNITSSCKYKKILSCPVKFDD